MSASMRVRIPPVAPQSIDALGETGVVEDLVWQALFPDGQSTFQSPTEALSSTDGGTTGGQLIRADSPEATFLAGALAGLEVKEGSALPADELRYFLAQLNEHGALLITMER